MAEVVPFKGVLYNSTLISTVSGDDLVAPPYDIITPEYQDELYRRSPYNIVRIDFGKEYQNDNGKENKYTRAKEYLQGWLKDRIMTLSKEPCFYAYEISYDSRGKEKTLRGFLGLVRLEELGKGNIYPHECTHDKPKKDRLALMRVCNANISPIFSLYHSPEKRTSGILSGVCRQRPYLEARDINGAVHRLREITEKNQVALIQEELSDKAIFIADGHHRYETALAFQKEMREKEGISESPRPYDYVLMFLANMSDEGLTILPAHRLVKTIPEDTLERLATYFTVEKVSDINDIEDSLGRRQQGIGFYKGGSEWYILTYREGDLSGVHPAQRALNVTILHELILKKLLNTNAVDYDMDIHRSLQLVKKKEYATVFFLNPTRVEEVEHVALASSRMPPKSTYFYPKLLTGLVLNTFNNSF